MTRTALAFAAVAALCLPADAQVSLVDADVVFLIDESGSMSGEQEWVESVIPTLSEELADEDIAARFGVVGFGGWDPAPRVVRTLGEADTVATGLADDLTTDGFWEDGWTAMDVALDRYRLDAAATNFVLVTDEDRDALPGSSLTYAGILERLLERNVTLNAVVDLQLGDDERAARTRNGVIGIAADGTSFLTDDDDFETGEGGFSGEGDGLTAADYGALALATGGAVWNLNILREGGDAAESFTSAFVAVKVEEVEEDIEETLSAVPLPAPAWMLLAGLGSLAALRRRRSR